MKPFPSFSIGRTLPVLAAIALLSSCTREDSLTPTTAGNTAVGSTKQLQMAWLTADQNLIPDIHFIKVGVMDGACKELGSLILERPVGSSGPFSIIDYAGYTPNVSFAAKDLYSNVVTVAMGTHNWVIAQDNLGNIYDVLEFDPHKDFDPSAGPADTPMWTVGAAGWSVAPQSGTNPLVDWTWLPYYQSFNHKQPFIPCGK